MEDKKQAKQKIKDLYKLEEDIGTELGSLLSEHLKTSGLLGKIDWAIDIPGRPGMVIISGEYYKDFGKELSELLHEINPTSGTFYHSKFIIKDSNIAATIFFNDGRLSISFDDIKDLVLFISNYKIKIDIAGVAKKAEHLIEQMLQYNKVIDALDGFIK